MPCSREDSGCPGAAAPSGLSSVSMPAASIKFRIERMSGSPATPTAIKSGHAPKFLMYVAHGSMSFPLPSMMRPAICSTVYERRASGAFMLWSTSSVNHSISATKDRRVTAASFLL
jgi:hypothetical protein